MDEKTDIQNRTACSRWILWTVGLTVLILVALAAVTIYIDPLFHYHPPLAGLQYPIDEERYQNDGILRHFEYDGILTGSSLSANNKASQAEALFGGRFIKIPFSGSSPKEIRDNLARAFNTGREIRTVIFDLRNTELIVDKDDYTDFDFPTYLYDSTFLNDVSYVLNKSIFLDRTLRVITYTRGGKQTTSFDQCYNWIDQFQFGKEAVLAKSLPITEFLPEHELTQVEQTVVRENIRQNIVSLANEHPETTFYVFFAPASICYWGNLGGQGRIGAMIDAKQIAIEQMLDCPNIRLFSFSDSFDLVCDLDNYKDSYHYDQWVNDWILESMASDEHRLTAENYHAYLENVRDFYTHYDYASIWE